MEVGVEGSGERMVERRGGEGEPSEGNGGGVGGILSRERGGGER